LPASPGPSQPSRASPAPQALRSPISSQPTATVEAPGTPPLKITQWRKNESPDKTKNNFLMDIIERNKITSMVPLIFYEKIQHEKLMAKTGLN
jgi:hypothetical protein